MILIWAVVLVFSVLSVLNLLLLLALVRRIRGLALAPATPADDGLPTLGHRVGAFVASGPDGVVTEEDLGSDAVVAFLSPECEPCRTEAALIVSGDLPLPKVLAFVVGDAADPSAAAFASSLAGVATVAFVEAAGPESTVFGGVVEFPTVLRVVGGETVAAAHAVEEPAAWRGVTVAHG